MTWNKVFGQERIKKILQRTILDDRIPHSYCFWGPDGTGKEALALEFAKTVNCINPIKSNDSISYCNSCNSCKLFRTLAHPNLQFIYSTPVSKSDTSDNPDDKQIDEMGLQLKLKSEDYYHKFQVQSGTQIRISSIRKIKRNLSMSAGMQGRRVIIVCRADEMSSDSSNAFLKTLEEPQENTTIILTTSKKEALLGTILSRCQMIHVPVLEDSDVREYAISYLDATDSEAAIIASYAEGSITRAMEFNNSDIQTLRTEIVDLLRIALTPKIYKQNLIKKIDELTKDKDKRKFGFIMNLIIVWFMDVIKFKNNPDSELVVNQDSILTLARFTGAFGDKDIQSAINIAEAAITRIKRNVPLNLILLDFCIQTRQLFINSN